MVRGPGRSVAKMAEPIGDRIRSVRKRRGMSQTELAEASSVSISLIRSLEQGQQSDTRLDTLRKLAVALRVPTAELAYHAIAKDAEVDQVSQWEPVRLALAGRIVPTADREPPDLTELEAEFATLKPMFRTGQFVALIPRLASLLTDADALASATSPPLVSARRFRSRVRQMAAWLMILTWQFDAADLAISLALD